jgi:hypothetical protein
MSAPAAPPRTAPYPVRAFTPAHADLPQSAGVPARLANERYVESLARLVYYWGYPAVDTFGRTSAWEVMKAAGPGATLGLFPGAPRNRMGYLDDYMPPSQRKVVTPNADTIYGAGFADLAGDSVVVQTPADVPRGHYWTIQVVDLFTTVTHQLGSARGTPGGKFLLVGPEWRGEKPEGFIAVLRSPTSTAGVFARSFTAHSDQARARARAVLNQMGMVPLSDDWPGRLAFDCEASARNKVFPPGLTEKMVAEDPDLLRVRPVNAETFWDDLQKALDANPVVGPDDTPMAAQARILLALRGSSASWRERLDHTALEVDAELHEGARYPQVGVDAGNGWQRQENGGAWGTDWFGRAQAAVVYIFVNDYHEAVYFIRATDGAGAPLYGRYRYTMTFPKGALPPVDRARGGFWSLTMYDGDYFMLADPPMGRTNLGTVSLDANELRFAADGSLTLHLSHAEPAGEEARANWLPAPGGPFSLIVRAYVPAASILDGSYSLPDVRRVETNGAG